jgi:hypothetical protein
MGLITIGMDSSDEFNEATDEEGTSQQATRILKQQTNVDPGKISGSDGGEYEYDCLLGCCAV